MTLRLRQINPGQRFVLIRTGERYEFIRRSTEKWGGTRYVVKREGEAKETTLHHSCHIKPIIRMQA